MWEEFENFGDVESMSLDEILSDADSDTDNGDGIQDRSVEKKSMRTKCPRISDCPLFPKPPFPTAGQVKKLLDSADYEMKGNKSVDRMRRVMDLRKSKVFDNDFDSDEQNEKRLDVVVGIDMLLVIVFHPPQGVTMIGMMPTYFSTEHHGKKMRRISALQLLEPKTHVYGKIMSVSRPIDTHVKFPPCVMGDTIKVEG